MWIGGKDGIALVQSVFAQKIIHLPAGFPQDAEAGGDIPAIDMRFPVAVETAIRGESKAERARAQPAIFTIGIEQSFDGLGMWRDRPTIAEADTEPSVFERFDLDDLNMPAVERRTLALATCVKLFADWIVDHADDEVVSGMEAERHAPERDAAQEIGGAVDWIDDPCCRCARILAAPLFTQESIIGKKLVERAGDHV